MKTYFNKIELVKLVTKFVYGKIHNTKDFEDYPKEIIDLQKKAIEFFEDCEMTGYLPKK